MVSINSFDGMEDLTQAERAVLAACVNATDEMTGIVMHISVAGLTTDEHRLHMIALERKHYLTCPGGDLGWMVRLSGKTKSLV